MVLHLEIWGGDLDDLFGGREFNYEQRVRINSSPGDFRLAMFIPAESSDLLIQDETLELGELSLRIRDESPGRRIHLDGSSADREREFVYRATLSIRKRLHKYPEQSRWRVVDTDGSNDLAATDLIQTGHPVVLSALLRATDIEVETGGAEIAGSVRTAMSPHECLSLIYSYCTDEIAPANFSGSTDALTTANLGKASCGGKSRLMAAMARSVGIPARLVGGVLLGEGKPKRTSHIWLECRLGDTWYPFDPLHDHFAELPGNSLPLSQGGEPLILYRRRLSIDYAFVAPGMEVPAVWQERRFANDEEGEISASGRGIPLLSRRFFSIILLAPFALLFTVFARQVIGLESMGTFLPVLIGFSLTQTGWLLGGLQLLLTVLLGLALRVALSRLNLLNVPRSAVMISFLVLITLCLSVALEFLDLPLEQGAAILPLAALAMTIERYTVVALDKGNRGALVLFFQTVLLAVGSYFVLEQSFFKALTVAFPEVLLLVLALLMVVGNYRGLRLRELWRFRQVLRAESEEEALA